MKQSVPLITIRDKWDMKDTTSLFTTSYVEFYNLDDWHTGSGNRSRPSKETREVIDMGKMSAVSLTSEVGRDHNNSSSSKKGFPLNGILKKKESKDQDKSTSRGRNKEAVSATGEKTE